MLANDPTQSRKKGAFFVIVHTDQEVAELMAECPKCGVITSYALELAWRLRTIACGECTMSMRLNAADLRGLREHLIQARVRIDRLIDGQSDPG
jgi:ribosomal protein S27AE